MRLQRYCSHVPLTTTQPSSIPPRHRKYASSGHIVVSERSTRLPNSQIKGDGVRLFLIGPISWTLTDCFWPIRLKKSGFPNCRNIDRWKRLVSTLLREISARKTSAKAQDFNPIRVLFCHRDQGRLFQQNRPIAVCQSLSVAARVDPFYTCARGENLFKVSIRNSRYSSGVHVIPRVVYSIASSLVSIRS